MEDVTADIWFTKGLAAYAKRNLATAEEAFSQAVSGNPENPNYLSYLGIVKGELGKKAEAADLLSRAVDLLPTSIPLRYTKAEVFLQSGKSEEAKPDFMRICADTDTESLYWQSLSHFNLGLIALSSENIEEAILELSDAEDIAKHLGDSGLIARISAELEKNGF